MKKDSLAQIQKSAKLEEKERKDLSITEEEVSTLISELRGEEGGKPFTIEEDKDFDFATELLLHAQEQVKDIEKRSKTVTQPIYQALEAFRDIYRPGLNGYKSVVSYLKPLVGAYTIKKKKEQEEAMKLIAQASKNDDFDTAMEISSRVQKVPEKKGVSVTIGYSFEVTDWSKVPERFRVQEIDTREMSAYIKKFKGKPKEVPGIKFVEAASVRKTTT